MKQGVRLRRACNAGVTLIEMLVVLALFGILAGAVVLTLPGDRPTARAEVAAAAWTSALHHAMDAALATGEGFGLRYRDSALTFVKRDADGQWQPHPSPDLAAVKLFPDLVRSSDQVEQPEVYAVSAALIPAISTAHVARFGAGTQGVSVRFDGATVRVIEGEDKTDETTR